MYIEIDLGVLVTAEIDGLTYIVLMSKEFAILYSSSPPLPSGKKTLL